MKLLKPPFLHLRTGDNHTGLSRSHPRVAEGNQMRSLKSIHWQRALPKRQVFLLPSVGLPLGTYGPKRSWLSRPGCTGLTHTASPSFPSLSFCASEILDLSTSPVHFRIWLLGPSRPSGGLWSPAPSGSGYLGAPPPWAPSFGTATGIENRPMGAPGSSLTALGAANPAEPGKGAQCWG